MKTLILNGRTVTVNTDQLSKGLCEMHEENNDKKALLKRLKYFRECGFSKLSNGWYYNRTVKEHLYTSLHYNL